MKTVTFALFISIYILSLNSVFAQKEIPAQARPLVDVLVSVKENDLNRFKSAFSSKVAKENTDWNSNLQEGRKTLLSRFGNYNIQDFEFLFSGDSQEGKVVLYYQKQPQFSMAVVKESKGWKLNEH